MDYIITIAAWNLGYDEADELVEALAELLEERGLGGEEHEGGDMQVRSVVALRPMGMTGLDVSTEPRLQRIMPRIVRGARLVTIPGSDDDPIRRDR